MSSPTSDIKFIKFVDVIHNNLQIIKEGVLLYEFYDGD